MTGTAKDWLLEKDPENPSIRYLALTQLEGAPPDGPAVVAARRESMSHGPIPAILAAQDPAGFWEKPGPGYSPKYRGTVWSMAFLAQLGADLAEPRIQASGEYLLAHAIASTGVFSMRGTPSGNIHCLSGNLGATLLDFGFGGDERLQQAVDLMARYVTGMGIAVTDDKKVAPRYLRSGACAPGFACSANDRLPCAWGAVKVLRALTRVPEAQRTEPIDAAQEACIDFLFSVDPATAAYPAGYSEKPSRSWFRFGFPVFYVTDILQTAEALTEAGFGGDPRLAATYDLLLSQRDKAGRWKMAYSYNGKTHADIEERGKPSKWVTLRALRVLRGREQAA